MKKICIYSCILFFVDFISKLVVLNTPNIEIIKNFLSIYEIYNKGVAFSLFYGSTIVISLITIIILIYILKNIPNKLNSLKIIYYSLLLGGILGNLFDRVVRGYVVDFISFNIFGFNFPVFNLADVFICIGIFLYFIEVVKDEKNGINSK